MNNGETKQHSGARLCFGLGFLVPAVLALTGYIVIKVWPFGNGTVLIIDSLHQYLPFYTNYYDKLMHNSSLFYSFSAGFGYDFWATFAYYLASPFNFLIVLVPRANVCDFMDYLILFKIAMCGGIFSWYLYRRMEKRGGGPSGRARVLLPVTFGVMFAMGNFIIGYYFNIMWLDSIAVLPLVMYGIEKISAGERGRIYGISLFYAIWCNYYIGFMICIFACLYLAAELISRRWLTRKETGKRILYFGWYSLLAGGMASLVLLPAYRALTASESMTQNSFPSKIKFYTDFVGLMLSHGAEQHPINISDSQVGLNAYCGTAVLILVILYFVNRKIPVREKIGKGLLAGILLLSFSMNMLNYIWHGFHTQNGLPNRFAFLYVAILLLMSFDVLLEMSSWEVWTTALAGILPVAFFLACRAAGAGDVEEYGNWLWLTPVLLLAWAAVFTAVSLRRLPDRISYLLIGCLLLAESSVHGIYGYIYNENVTRDIYLKDQASWQKMIRPKEDGTFFRSEIDSQRMRSVTMFAGGNSTVIFNSMMQVSVTDFCDAIGMEARTNKNGYNGVTELMNDVFGIRYVLSSIGKGDALYHFPKMKDDGNLTAYVNENALPIGFLVNSEIRFWDTTAGDPIELQNDFVTMATGKDPIFNLDRTIDAESGKKYEIKVPDGKQVYLYLPDRVDSFELNTPEYDRTYKTYTDHLYTVNALDGENIADFTIKENSGKKTRTVSVYTCPDQALQEVVDVLAEHPLTNARVEGSRLSGQISSPDGGILLLTVPWSPNWTLKVDGEKQDLLEIGGMFAGVDLTPGEHEIAMAYVPGGFWTGLVLSFICLGLLLLTIFLEKRMGYGIVGKDTADMKIHFAKRCDRFGAGIFAVLNDKKEEMLAEGRTIWNLSVGTPDFETPQAIMDAVSEAARHPENYRYSLRDLPELTRAVADFYDRRFGVQLAPEEIMSVYGSQEGMAHIALVLCDPGDVVLVPNPGYPIFKIGPELCGAETWEYPLLPENRYLPDLDAIPREILSRARLMVVNYPGNPLCAVAPDEFYEKLIAFARENDIVILHDNAYADIIFGGREGRSILSFEAAKDVAVEFYSLSKTFDYTGARMSFLVGNAEVIKRFKAIRSQIDYGIFLPVQYGAIAALNRPAEEAKAQSDQYEERARTLCEGLRGIGWDVPDTDGTMFVWAPLPEGYTDSDSFCMELMEKAGVICTPGSSFGSLGNGYVRFALVLPPDRLAEAVESIARSGIIREKKEQ